MQKSTMKAGVDVGRGVPAALATVAVLLAGCGGPYPGEDPYSGDEQFGVSTEAITEGNLDSGHLSVGLLEINRVGGETDLCTGTLVGGRTVITAAHCAVQVASARFILGGEILGGQLSGGQVYNVITMTPHPAYQAESANPENDVAVIGLETAPPVTPTPISRMAPWAGLGVTLVGFGATSMYDDSSDARKRSALNTVESVDQTTLILSSATGGLGGMACFGDSGGPTFAYLYGNQVQVSLHSHGTSKDDPCEEVVEMRLDPYADWIKQVAQGDVLMVGDATKAAIPSSSVSGTGAVSGDPNEVRAVACTYAPLSGRSAAGYAPLALLLLCMVGQRIRRRR